MSTDKEMMDALKKQVAEHQTSLGYPPEFTSIVMRSREGSFLVTFNMMAIHDRFELQRIKSRFMYTTFICNLDYDIIKTPEGLLFTWKPK